MPRAESSSSGEEEEADNPSSESHLKQTDKTTKYECPADFVSFCHKPCSSTLTDSLKNNHNDLWLIKAPANFNPQCFSGLQVPLSGLQTVKVPSAASGAQSAQQIFTVLASQHGSPDLCLLTGDKRMPDKGVTQGMVLGPAFVGLLNVCETYGDLSANQSPHIIPAAPAPTIPPGLKQRFHPFGSKTPVLTYVAESEVDGAAFGPSSATLRPLVSKCFSEESSQEEGEDQRKKKKKKKKSVKREREQQGQLVQVKEEPVAQPTEGMTTMMVEQQEEGEKRKKKKRKKDKEREEVEAGVEPSVTIKQEPEVKSEPMDARYGDVVTEGSAKKKKKKKKIKTDDD